MTPQTRRTASIVASAIVLAAIGTTLGSYPTYLLTLAMINVIAAVGLNLLTGNSGQISLCHSSFMAIGAYASSLCTARLDVPFWAAIPLGAIVAALLGALLGAPASRLKGIYLALATLGFLQIVQVAIEELASVTGGVRGLNVPKPSIGGMRVTEYGIFTTVLCVCALAIWTARNLLASRVGRELEAVRQSPAAAQALGVSVARVKLAAFALSAAYAGAAGGLLAITVGFIDPVEFGVSASLRQITFIVVGGMGSVAGSVIGATVLSALPEVLRPVKEYSDIIYTLILLGFLLVLPRGLVTLWPRAPRPRPRDQTLPAAGTSPPERRPAAPGRSLPPFWRGEAPAQRASLGGGFPMTDRLTVDRLTVRFGGLVAVRDVSLRVAPGEIRGLIGPNGAGKTTVINAITGLVRIASGRVLLDDAVVSGLPAHAISRRGIGRTFQHVEPFGELTVLENVLLGVGRHAPVSFAAAALATSRARRIEAEAVREADAILERFELAPYRDTPAAQLPFGALKRMDLARALAARPTLLLMDEPTSGMSESEADHAIEAARTLAESGNVTLLVIEHNMRVMMALADRVTAMQNGAVIGEGTPREIQGNRAVIDAYLGEEALDAAH
ncbi:MAG TPA: branched-chain amino acid ABC transporter ATP-binding protein/permease [Casimicrobiaceae bacterium]